MSLTHIYLTANSHDDERPREILAEFSIRSFTATNISSLDTQDVQPKRTLDLGCGAFALQVIAVSNLTSVYCLQDMDVS